MKDELEEQALRDNLRDAGCGGKMVEKFLALEAEGEREAQLRLLFAHRKLLLKRLKKDNPDIEKSVFNSIHSVCLDTMPGWKTKGETHSFLEHYDRE